MAEQKKGVAYTFSGEYYTGSKETVEQVKNYELTVNFPEETPIALSLFKTSLTRTKDAIFKMMIKKYPDFKAVRTYVITNVKNLDNSAKQPKDIASMNTKQLAKYIAEKGLEIDVEVYDDDLAKLREVIVLAEKDVETFKKVYEADVQAHNFNKSINSLNDVKGEEGEGKDGNKDNIEDLLG